MGKGKEDPLCDLGYESLLGGSVLNAGYTVSVRRTRVNIIVLLTLALTGESPTCILHEGICTPSNTLSKYHRQLSTMSSDQLFFGRSHSCSGLFLFLYHQYIAYILQYVGLPDHVPAVIVVLTLTSMVKPLVTGQAPVTLSCFLVFVPFISLAYVD